MDNQTQPNQTQSGPTITVIGAGIVGVCTALELQQRGHAVTLVDRKPAGQETSFGNAGVLSESSVIIPNSPGFIKNLPKLLLNRTKGFRYSPIYLLKQMHWASKFLSYCTDQQLRSAAVALRELQVLSLEQHKNWIKQTQVQHLFRESGWLKVFRTQQAFDSIQADLKLLDQVGVKYTLLNDLELNKLEPGLNPIFSSGVLLQNTCRVTDPESLTKAYLQCFTSLGGIFKQAELTGLEKGYHTWDLKFNHRETHQSNHVVLCTGPWSSNITRKLGYKIPMIFERGFHVHLRPFAQTHPLNRAVYDVDGGFVLAPMTQGVRLTTGVELAEQHAPPNIKQIQQAIDLACEAHAMEGPLESAPWVGSRPTLADSLPIISQAPKKEHRGLWFNFGHQHIGLSIATGSARIIRSLIENKRPPVNHEPYRAERFF